MKAIGLQPTTTGEEEGGPETGDSVYHYIVPDGPFDTAVKKLLARGFSISWIEKPPAAKASGQDAEGQEQEPDKAKSGKRVKYTCPSCGLNAWAKHDVRLVCGADMIAMDPAA